MRYSKTCECEIVQESGHSGSQRLALHRNERVQRSADEYRGGILSIASVRTNHSGVRRRGHADLDVDHHGPLSSIHTQSTYFILICWLFILGFILMLIAASVAKDYLRCC